MNKVLEGYLVVPADVCKDASTEATALAVTLDWVQEELSKRNLDMPDHLVIEVVLLLSKLCFNILFPSWVNTRDQPHLGT